MVFTPTRFLPAHPWSKGKVEKPFGYIEAHFIAGSSFEDFPDLQNKLKLFQLELNKRIHAIIKTAPAELFEKESLGLLALPENRYTGVKKETRKTSFDCLIAFNDSRYSVPWMFAGYLEKNHKQSFRIEPVKTNTELPKVNVKRELSQYKLFK